MSKFLYRVDGSRYGGELAIGKVTAEFVRYWQDKEQDDLVSHVVGLDWDDSEDVDTNSPDPYEDMTCWNNWYECDDVEHENNGYADDKFCVHNVTGAEPMSEEAFTNWDDDAVDVDGHYLACRECYAQKEEPEDLEGYTPVLCFHSAEKGGFGQWFIETDEPFDPNKLCYTHLETDLCTLVENLYYNKQPLECEYDYSDGSGKGYYAYVGWLKDEWHDKQEQLEGIMEDTWADYDTEMEELKQEERKEYEKARAQKIIENPGWESE